MIKIFLLLLLLSSPAINAGEFKHFNEWTTAEKVEYSAYLGLTVIDYHQTMWAIRQHNEHGEPLFKEANPLFGPHPDKSIFLIAQLASSGIYYYMIGNSVDPKYRASIFGIRLAVVIHNDSVGARISKVF